MSITYVRGDLFAANERAIAHGCNCHGYMGAGVAAIVKDKYPMAFRVYQQACTSRMFYPGLAQPVPCLEQDRPSEATVIYNLATQNAPGANARIDYVQAAFANMKRHMDFTGNRRVAMPKIGAGIGGLHWLDVEAVLYDVFNQHMQSGSDAYDIIVYEL